MTICNDLRQAVLQAAVQGNLTEQLPSDSSVDELLSSISSEKEELVRQKKIKKEKPLPAITEDEIPFDIPENWRWVRLRTVVYNRGQITPQDTFSYIDIGSIDNKKHCLNNDENILTAKNAPSRARKIVKLGDILYSTVRPYLHNMCIIDREFTCTPIASTGFAAMTCYNGILNKYLFYFLLSPAFDAYANDSANSKGVAYPAINDERLYRAVIAIPPIEEQQRIVEKVEGLMAKIDEIEKTEQALESIKSTFPGDMKASILQAAMQGKLTEQLPANSSVDELLSSIAAEKGELIKQKKIKKEQALPAITEDEIAFDIPENWRWVRLENLCIKEIKRGKSPAYVENSSVLVFAQKCNTKYNGIDISLAKCLDLKVLEKYPENEYMTVNDIVINSTGTGTLGRVGFIRREDLSDSRIVPDSHVTTVRISEQVLPKYIYYFLSANQKYLESLGEGSTNQKELKATAIQNLVVPVPPFEEQQRIVEKLDKLLPLCDNLEIYK